MSRSYKKTPYYGERKSKYWKRYANKKLRRQKLIHNYKYSDFRKDCESYKIQDFYWYGPRNFEDYYKEQISNYIRFPNLYEDIPTREYCRKVYNKLYRRK